MLMPSAGSGGSSGGGGGGGNNYTPPHPTHIQPHINAGPGPPSSVSVVTPSGARVTTSVPAGVPASQARSPARIAASLIPLKPPNAPSLAPLLGLLPTAFRPYAPDVLSAAKRYNVQPSLLLGLMQVESGLGTDPNTFSGSSAGAQGVSQFMPGTAPTIKGPGVRHGVDISNTPKGIRTQIFGAANLLTSLGVQKDVITALAGYNAGPAAPVSAAGTYPQDVLAAAKQFKVADKLAQSGGRSSGPYVSPFAKAKSFTQSRTDEGVDYTGTGLITSPGKAKYLGIGQGPGWASGGGGGTGYGVVEKLLKGPKAGKKIFLYEGIAPAGPQLSPGDTIKKGQPIASFVPGGSIEMGWSDASGAPIAQPTYSEGDVTQPGLHFQKFLSRRGAASAPGQAAISGSGTGARAPLGLTPGSPAAAVASSTGVNPITAQTAVADAKQQNRPANPALVSLTPPTMPTGVPFPQALADLFGGSLPSLGGGAASGPASGMSTTDLATLLAQLQAPQAQNPLQLLTNPPRRRRRR